MTLEKLARELRKIFDFKYLTVHKPTPNCENHRIVLWGGTESPFYRENDDSGFPWHRSEPLPNKTFIEADLSERWLKQRLDLSKYTDKNGNIDYSKCIVEVE